MVNRMIVFALLAPCVHPLSVVAQEVTKLSDQQTTDLIRQLESPSKNDVEATNSELRYHREAVLRELMKRGDDALQLLLDFRQRLIVNENNRRADQPGLGDSEQLLANDVALLTALRHLQGKSPPLTIDVQGSSVPIQGKTRALPELHVEVVNTDPDRSAVWFKFGGDYRSGRLARWRIHVWDEESNRLPVLPNRSWIGGGVYTEGNLAFGERDLRCLALSDYVQIRRPGTYKAQVFYHDSIAIADIERPDVLDALVVSKSEPFDLRIAKGPMIAIHLTRDDRQRTRQLLQEMEFSDKVKLIGGKYESFYHTFIDPESSHGQLLSMGTRAVPALLERVQEEEADFMERAWILGILDSILHERHLCPTEFDGVLPGYVSKAPGCLCSGRIHRDSYSPTAQNKLIREWVEFANDYIEIHDLPNAINRVPEFPNAIKKVVGE